MGPGSSPGPGDKDVHHLVLGNRRGTHRPGRLRQDPTPLPAPGQPHRQDRQGPRTKRRNMRKAAERTRNRIRNLNLIDELHHQTARFLVDHFDPILLPTFETQDMSKKGGRKLRSKSVRSLLTFAHYRFQRFPLWKARQTGAKALLINEAYTSKTCSWSGEIVNKLGGARYITGQDGSPLNATSTERAERSSALW